MRGLVPGYAVGHHSDAGPSGFVLLLAKGLRERRSQRWHPCIFLVSAGLLAILLTASCRYPHHFPAHGEDVGKSEFQVLPQDPRHYEITFEASYSVGGKRKGMPADSVRIYFEELLPITQDRQGYQWQ